MRSDSELVRITIPSLSAGTSVIWDDIPARPPVCDTIFRPW